LRARTRQMDALKTALRTQPHSFVLKFVEQGGLEALLDFLGNLDHETKQSPLHTTLIGCLKALMNNSVSKILQLFLSLLLILGTQFYYRMAERMCWPILRESPRSPKVCDVKTSGRKWQLWKFWAPSVWCLEDTRKLWRPWSTTKSMPAREPDFK
jgi:hypothetical protein